MVLESIFAQKKKYIALYDFNKIKHIPFPIMLKIAKWLKLNEENYRLYNLHTVYVTSAVLPKILLNTLFTIQKPVYSYSIVNEMDEANELAVEKIKEKYF